MTGRGEKLTARQELDLFRATDDVMDLPLELRTFGISRLLENLPEDTTVEAQENGLRLRLSQWKKGGILVGYLITKKIRLIFQRLITSV